MSSTYSTNLALELIGTGDQAGTWGSTTNTNIGTLLEQAISGYTTQTITDGADTVITIPNGASGQARNMFIECTGTLTAARNLIVPANKKLYFIYNNTTGGYAVTVKVSGQTGVSVPSGAKVVLVSNGTDVVVATNYMVSLTLGAALPIASGGTGQTTANAALNALLPSQATAANKYLGSNGTNSSWSAIDISTASITGTLPVANGGTGVTTSTGTGSVVLSNSPTLVTPALGTPSALTLTNATGLSLTTGVTGTLPVANGGTGITSFGTGVAPALGQAVTGSGGIVLSTSATLTSPTLTSPTLTTPALGTPASGVMTNVTGLPLTTGVTGTLPVANGGTGATSLTANNVILGNGTSAVQVVAPSTSGNVLTSNGTTWTSATPAALGVGQTWQNLTGSRAVGTTYTNSTGKPIMVNVFLAGTGASSSVSMYVDGIQVGYAQGDTTNGAASSTLSAVVPNGSTYQVTGSRTLTGGLWSELR